LLGGSKNVGRSGESVRTILVDGMGPPPPYQRAAEAIVADLHCARHQRSAADEAQIRGKRFTGFAITDAAICLCLDDSSVLRVTASGTVVDWSIVPLHTVTLLPSGEFSPARMVYPDGQSFVWNPAKHLECRLGYGIRGLVAGQTYLNIGFRDGGALRFGLIRNRTSGLPIICVSELEPLGGTPVGYQPSVDESGRKKKPEDGNDEAKKGLQDDSK
jgi:hypothetical protein